MIWLFVISLLSVRFLRNAKVLVDLHLILVLPHLKIERRTGWVIINLTGGKFHETLTSAFLRASEGSDRPPPSHW
jgi:hypothetical protein